MKVIFKPNPHPETIIDFFSRYSLDELERIAAKYGIYDLAQDYALKHLQVILLMGLHALKARTNGTSNDYEDRRTYLEYEGKTTTREIFSILRGLKQTILDRYRQVDWFFSTFKGWRLQEIYYVRSHQLEHYIKKWEKLLHKKGPENDSKVTISTDWVQQNGCLLWSRGRYVNIVESDIINTPNKFKAKKLSDLYNWQINTPV